MRILTLVLATLFILAGAGLGVVRMNTNFDHATSMEQALETAKKLQDNMKKAGVTAGVKELKAIEGFEGKPSMVRVGAIVMLATAVVAFILLIMTYIKKEKLTILLGFGVIVLIGLMIFINPDYQVGLTSAASARTAAYIIGIPLGLGALLAMASEKLRQKKVLAA